MHITIYERNLNDFGREYIYTDAGTGHLAAQRPQHWLERKYRSRAGAGNGVIHIHDIPVVWNIVWNATAAFIAVIIISLLLDESGFFEWAALHVSRWGNGRGRLLFTWIVLLGAAVAALFANDGAALILTPIVIAMLLAWGSARRRLWPLSWLQDLLLIPPACR
jgi:hypothetical protein